MTSTQFTGFWIPFLPLVCTLVRIIVLKSHNLPYYVYILAPSHPASRRHLSHLSMAPNVTFPLQNSPFCESAVVCIRRRTRTPSAIELEGLDFHALFQRLAVLNLPVHLTSNLRYCQTMKLGIRDILVLKRHPTLFRAGEVRRHLRAGVAPRAHHGQEPPRHLELHQEGEEAQR